MDDATVEATLRDITEGWPNDDERFDRGMAAARALLDAGLPDPRPTEAEARWGLLDTSLSLDRTLDTLRDMGCFRPEPAACQWCGCVGYHAEMCEGFAVNDPAEPESVQKSTLSAHAVARSNATDAPRHDGPTYPGLGQGRLGLSPLNLADPDFWDKAAERMRGTKPAPMVTVRRYRAVGHPHNPTIETAYRVVSADQIPEGWEAVE